MKTMILSSHPPGGTTFTLPALATASPDYAVTSPLEIAFGKIAGKHPAPTLPAKEKRRNTHAAKTTRLRLAQLHYALLVLSLGGAVGFLTLLLLQIIGNTLAMN
jgi:hypothetical protein